MPGAGSRVAYRRDPKHGEPGRDPLELGGWRVPGDGQVRPGVRRPLQVGSQHGRAAVYRKLFQVHLLARTVTQGGISPPASLTLRTQFVPSPSMDTR